MKLLTFILRRIGFFVFTLMVNVSPSAQSKDASLSIHAVIATKGVGCEVVLPENVLQFKPLQANKLTGAVQTYQVKPLVVQLSCVDETESIQPMLTLQGTTPYSEDIQQVIFLDGPTNGVGFMVRQSPDDRPIALADFYRPDDAIGHQGNGQRLTVLNNDNLYRADTLLWVGLVGPLQSTVVPGHFHASLTLNVEFQ